MVLNTDEGSLERMREASEKGHRVLRVDGLGELGADVVGDFSRYRKWYLQEVVLRTYVVSLVSVANLMRLYDCERRKWGGFFDVWRPIHNGIVEWSRAVVIASIVEHLFKTIRDIWEKTKCVLSCDTFDDLSFTMRLTYVFEFHARELMHLGVHVWVYLERVGWRPCRNKHLGVNCFFSYPVRSKWTAIPYPYS